MIGIVGGVGPLAGLDLFRKITEQTSADCDQEHLPVLLFSFPHRIKDRTEYLEGIVKENPGIAIAEICLELSKAGATVVGIPCNTAHSPGIFNVITDRLELEGSSLKIVHMIDETIEFIRQTLPQCSFIGILSTTGTYRQKIYFDKLLDAGYIPVIPDEITQVEKVHNSVYDPGYGIKTQHGIISERAKSQLYEVMDLLLDNGAQAFIMGCTEIPLAVEDDRYKGMILFDPAKILARALIREYLNTK